MQVSQIVVLATNSGTCRNTSLCFPVAAVVNVHPHHILGSCSVVYDLGTLDDSIRTKISAALAGKQLPNKRPFHQVGAGITIDGLEGTSVQLVLADPVVDRVNFDDS